MYHPIGKEGGVGLEGNDAWDDWFGSKVDVPGHTGEVIVPPADPSEVYSMTRHDSLVDEGGSPKKTERLCKVSKD
ncbi:hypothetical protein Pmar_PMAR000551 [Perkinsus marinus ATCC 50983]|uniref:Uncharacterized protein n=1 Tax=Perkinsus marinus (strain ATCC 50983 / TXsc) TaxID=423536 RepID=C5LIX9_PERM5|nr:hypothetical protein Pmar_PMAR000551 [Perkinsus marinus ATCC 50983]EER03314.1 hypothetical protein Pmar_PMAR000551 [Perkinsus marinus ATCC 50983]|eukprot:XP_002771498.1 hypothetical protein Pmar_PMAR000551 [Perkinsus marinus ATCC 50983]